MPKKFYVKESDTYLPIAVNGDLTGSTVRIPFRVLGSDTTNDLPNTVTNAAAGEIRLGIGSLTAGVYEFEVEQTQGGVIAHYPNRGYDLIIVGADL